MDIDFNMSDMLEFAREHMENDKIEFRKKMSQISSVSRNNSKSGKCFYCGDLVKSYCNSHSIPASFLKNISLDGKLYTSFGHVDLPPLDKDVGVNKAGTFLFICRDCDSKIFKDYESKENYNEKPNQKMLAQIAMKNYLKSTSQRYSEIAIHETLGKEQGLDLSKISEVKDTDLLENIEGFKRAKKVSKKPLQEEYYLFLYEKLDYVVPIAFQHQIALAIDLEGNMINNLHNQDRSYKIQMLHLAIFPMEDSSVVLMFIDKKDSRYRSFAKQMNNLSVADKLMYINYIVFCYSEDYYLSKSINEDVITNDNLRKVSGITGISFLDSGLGIIEKLRKHYTLNRAKDIPNILMKKYRVER